LPFIFYYYNIYSLFVAVLLKAVKKLFQIVQEKKPKNANVKNANETKRIEKEYKRLQLELNKVKIHKFDYLQIF
jgi:hypothetical protein